jgi:hypothetical protein
MRRLLTLAAALVLALSLSLSGALAETAYTASLGGREMYTVTFHDSYVLDDETFSEDSTDDYTWFMMLCTDEYAIDCGANLYYDDESFNLYSAAESERDEYIKSFGSNSDDDIYTYLETYTAPADGKNVPFVICTRSEAVYGDSYVAFTVLAGYDIYFEAYSADGMNTPEILASLKELLDTFVPAV